MQRPSSLAEILCSEHSSITFETVKFIVIGITDNPEQHFVPEVLDIIQQGKTFSGGMRHHELMHQLLPEGYDWIDVKAPLCDVFNQYKERQSALGDESIVVFASGDPLFYGFAATLQREFPDAEMKVYPAFSSLQMLAHRLALPYGEMQMVSVTGRPWTMLDTALIQGRKLIGVLTDGKKTPRAIADRLLEYGYGNYRLHLGENLGNTETERVRTFALEDVPADVARLNCVILQQNEPRTIPFGLPESDFALLDGRVNMITKMPIRLATLAALELHHKQCLWDVGFCTGSVSIEARLRFPHLLIEAFEIRPEGDTLMRENCRRFGAPGINHHIGDFLETDLANLPRPDAVFIGGHGGHLAEIVARIKQHLLPNGIIVFNSVSENSLTEFERVVGPVTKQHIALDSHNPITIMKATL